MDRRDGSEGAEARDACGYCLSAHTYLGKNLAKLDDPEMAANREGGSQDKTAEAAVRFAVAIVRERGHVSAAELQAVKGAGYTDARPEQAILIRVTAWDVNCPQHIPQRFQAADVAKALAARDARIAALEAEVASLRGAVAGGAGGAGGVRGVRGVRGE